MQKLCAMKCHSCHDPLSEFEANKLSLVCKSVLSVAMSVAMYNHVTHVETIF